MARTHVFNNTCNPIRVRRISNKGCGWFTIEPKNYEWYEPNGGEIMEVKFSTTNKTNQWEVDHDRSYIITHNGCDYELYLQVYGADLRQKEKLIKTWPGP
jgi:hypothetical protein